MPDYEFDSQDKIVLQMTRDGLSQENLSTGDTENISQKKSEVEYNKQTIETTYDSEEQKQYFNNTDDNVDVGVSDRTDRPEDAVNNEAEGKPEDKSTYSHGEFFAGNNAQREKLLDQTKEAVYNRSKQKFERSKKEYGKENKSHKNQEFERDSSSKKEKFERDPFKEKPRGDSAYKLPTGSRKEDSLREFDRKIEKWDKEIKIRKEKLPEKARLKFSEKAVIERSSKNRLKGLPISKSTMAKKSLWNSWAESRRQGRDEMHDFMISSTKKRYQNINRVNKKLMQSATIIHRYTSPQAKLKSAVLKANDLRVRKTEKAFKMLSPAQKQAKKETEKQLKKQLKKMKIKKSMITGHQNVIKRRNFITKAKDAVVQMVRAVKSTLSIAGAFSTLILILVCIVFGGSFFLAICIGYVGGAVVDSTYQADYDQISGCSAYMQKLETDLEERIGRVKEDYSDCYEYIYDLGEIKHNAIALMSYLAAKYVDFDLEKCRDELDVLFGEMYNLTIDVVEEQRERELRDEYGNIIYDVDGNPIIEIFMAKICYIKLTVKPLEEIIESRLDAEQKKAYDIYMLSSGGQQIHFNPLPDVEWGNLISSKFGERIHPVTGKRSYHNGLDIAVPTGTPLHATAAGVVTTSAYSETAGEYIIITMDDGWTVTYMHLDKRNVALGTVIEKGQFIGETGNTGRSTGPHLHLEVRNAENMPVDPTFMVPSSSMFSE